MDIKQAKQEIKNSVLAYLSKDECGEYKLPMIHQRPILMMGPPGIGKTQIMEQIAEECGFHSTTNFIRSFREHVGCTPKQFRRTVTIEANGRKKK